MFPALPASSLLEIQGFQHARDWENSEPTFQNSREQKNFRTVKFWTFLLLSFKALVTVGRVSVSLSVSSTRPIFLHVLLYWIMTKPRCAAAERLKIPNCKKLWVEKTKRTTTKKENFLELGLLGARSHIIPTCPYINLS